ncbi:response regulator transcription factor [Algiphilus aromaticivorans]|uniref:response regulator transcription factor n=1 Tax=Algiphilus aromaticivorans TaxID=382454 RepID=UPI0005C18623|nr:response regulator [Algiphilus aromaticivorans]
MTERARRRDIVLVVDDAPDTLRFLTDTLEGAGVTVLIATDGESCLALVDEVTPHLILMDAMMPGLDGFQTCRRLKQEKGLQHVPVIFMTGLSDTEHVLEGLQAGGVDYVAKPIVVEELLARIRVHLANARVTSGSQMALDATGRFLLAIDGKGMPLWCTPRAEQLLAEVFGGEAPEASLLPPEVSDRLRRICTDEPAMQSAFFFNVGERRLELTFISATGPDEFLFRLDDRSPGREEALLQEQLGLTRREADVLLWISRGKANRDISAILDISPRTVNKHLEQIFEKLGVDNRASAAARAVRALS